MENIKEFTVLVVDDMPDNLRLMSDLLKDVYNVKVSRSGEPASQKRHRQRQPHCTHVPAVRAPHD